VASGIKITKADRDFANEIKARDNWTCCRCGKYKPPPNRGLHCAHYFTRRTKVTRLDPDNAMALCYGCHQFVDSHAAEKEALWRSKIGDERFEALMLRAHNVRRGNDPSRTSGQLRGCA
jgi:hypothetical protein